MIKNRNSLFIDSSPKEISEQLIKNRKSLLMDNSQKQSTILSNTQSTIDISITNKNNPINFGPHSGFREAFNTTEHEVSKPKRSPDLDSSLICEKRISIEKYPKTMGYN